MLDHCEVYWELISCAMDGALTAGEEQRLKAHLAQCPECRALMAQMQDVREAVPGVEPAPEGFADAVMAAAARTPQEIPFTDLPQNRDLHAEGRAGLKAWWKPIRQLGALAACFLVILGLGTMAARSGLFAGGNSSGAAPSTDTAYSNQAVMDESSTTESAEDDAVAEDTVTKPALGEGHETMTVTIRNVDGVDYVFTGDVTADLPEGFSYGGETEQGVYYSGEEAGVLYFGTDAGFERWVKLEE